MVEQTAAAASSLAEQSQALKRAVAVFRLAGGGEDGRRTLGYAAAIEGA